MKNLRPRLRLRSLAARVRGERLFLASDLRCELVMDFQIRIDRAFCDEDALPGLSGSGYGFDADRQAFARSVAFERLGAFYLRLGSVSAAFRAFRDGALAALSGEEYDHGEESLPARFLRIRFYDLFERAVSCLAEEPRLEPFGNDPDLVAEARRLGGEYL